MKDLCLLVTITTWLVYVGCHSHTMHPEAIIYSRAQLLALKPVTYDRLPIEDYRKLTDYNINRIASTRRGTTAGCNKQRNISTIITQNQSQTVNPPRPPSNLIHIPCISQDKDSPKLIDMCLLNSRSVNNKVQYIKDYVVTYDIDFCAITETWLKPGPESSQTIEDLCPEGYRLPHEPRLTRGGGTGLLHKKSL